MTHYHFITGRLAEHALRQVLAALAPSVPFDYSVEVLNITVAALMTPAWIAARLHCPAGADKVFVPGYCAGDLAPIAAAACCSVERGPRDLRRLPQFFGRPVANSGYGGYDIEILAEINHAPSLSREQLLQSAAELRAAGADWIDLGCTPGSIWSEVGDAVRALRGAGHRVSIDSLQPAEIEPAVQAGAELVLSVNGSNRERAADWGCEVVAIPDDPHTLAGLDETVDFLASAGVRLRIDPILEPIGFGFAASLGRYLAVRQRYPDVEMLMGIGNLTELTDADSAAINVLLLGFCQEQGIRSVLTTQVIPWAKTSVRECDLARRLVFHAVQQQVLPKRLEPRLVLLRGAEPLPHEADYFSNLAAQITDHNYRLFAEQSALHLVAAGLHLQDRDPFALFAQLLATHPRNLDLGHAFYLGFELAKATTALTLDKEYRQDEALDWGFLTAEEKLHRLPRTPAAPDSKP
ncbi:MAG TPA: DUF6513 domain-containing protein [Pirellulales bacterium]|nr:DUF6513 domain-containing protein [Pirellulales bacterium]